jgi:hypothetical protein
MYWLNSARPTPPHPKDKSCASTAVAALQPPARHSAAARTTCQSSRRATGSGSQGARPGRANRILTVKLSACGVLLPAAALQNLELQQCAMYSHQRTAGPKRACRQTCHYIALPVLPQHSTCIDHGHHLQWRCCCAAAAAAARLGHVQATAPPDTFRSSVTRLCRFCLAGVDARHTCEHRM